jgi:hypothetical protein
MKPQIVDPIPSGPRPTRLRRLLLGVIVSAVLAIVGCSHVGRLQNVGHVVSPRSALEQTRGRDWALLPLFGDTLIGLAPGTADSSVRFLGRLRTGFTADTLNIFLCGDNRPGFRLQRLSPEFRTIQRGLSFNPIKFLHGLVTVPVVLVKGLYPDLALVRELPAIVTRRPKWGREEEVMRAMMAKIDSLKADGQEVAAVINVGDLVKDGRHPDHWERFLRLTEPLTSKVPYFPVAGNHERTHTEDGLENWRTATGLPITSDRLHYCFDSADGWVRFIALDSNPIVNHGDLWTRDLQVQYAEEQFNWMVARVREHRGPVLVFLHHPPFTAGVHHIEWQRDSLLVEQRERMVRALHETGISVLVAGHDHCYQRALLTWPDAVLISVVTGGAGSPLHTIPSPANCAKLFSEYKVAGSVIEPENVFTAQVFNFVHLRLWFGGGELHTYAVDENSNVTLVDEVEIDLNRYGIPEIDQEKRPIAPAEGPSEPSEDVTSKPDSAGTPELPAPAEE